jgi:hypothetical protein
MDPAGTHQCSAASVQHAELTPLRAEPVGITSLAEVRSKLAAHTEGGCSDADTSAPVLPKITADSLLYKAVVTGVLASWDEPWATLPQRIAQAEAIRQAFMVNPKEHHHVSQLCTNMSLC